MISVVYIHPLFSIVLEATLSKLVGEGNPMHYQIINIDSIYRIPSSLLGASILCFGDFCEELIRGHYPGIKEIKGEVRISSITLVKK